VLWFTNTSAYSQTNNVADASANSVANCKANTHTIPTPHEDTNFNTNTTTNSCSHSSTVSKSDFVTYPSTLSKTNTFAD
jgi:hypothetical protein